MKKITQTEHCSGEANHLQSKARRSWKDNCAGSLSVEGIKVYRLPKKRKHKDLIIYSRKRSFAHAMEPGNTAFSMQQTVGTEKAEAAGHPVCRTLNMQEEKVKCKTQKSRLRYVIIHCFLAFEERPETVGRKEK
jgi:hypothetical protein